MITNQLLYQLSYTGFWCVRSYRKRKFYQRSWRFRKSRSYHASDTGLAATLGLQRSAYISSCVGAISATLINKVSSFGRGLYNKGQ